MSRIGPDHLGREANIYVRQSTPDQVIHNLESRRRQYALADRARRSAGPRSASSMTISAALARGSPAGVREAARSNL